MTKKARKNAGKIKYLTALGEGGTIPPMNCAMMIQLYLYLAQRRSVRLHCRMVQPSLGYFYR